MERKLLKSYRNIIANRKSTAEGGCDPLGVDEMVNTSRAYHQMLTNENGLLDVTTMTGTMRWPRTTTTLLDVLPKMLIELGRIFYYEDGDDSIMGFELGSYRILFPVVYDGFNSQDFFVLTNMERKEVLPCRGLPDEDDNAVARHLHELIYTTYKGLGEVERMDVDFHEMDEDGVFEKDNAAIFYGLEQSLMTRYETESELVISNVFYDARVFEFKGGIFLFKDEVHIVIAEKNVGDVAVGFMVVDNNTTVYSEHYMDRDSYEDLKALSEEAPKKILKDKKWLFDDEYLNGPEVTFERLIGYWN